MSGPEERKEQPVPAQPAPPPPGHFLSQELESDCARFLEHVRTLVRRRELGAEASRAS